MICSLQEQVATWLWQPFIAECSTLLASKGLATPETAARAFTAMKTYCEEAMKTYAEEQ